MDLRRFLLMNTPYEAKTSGEIATFRTSVEKPLKVVAQINPVQDLHGYANPWISTTAEQVPYNFRAVYGSAPEVSNRIYDTLIGGTVAWNQIVQNGNFVDASGWAFGNLIGSASVANNIVTVTYSQESTGGYRTAISRTLPSADMSHKYLLLFDAKSDFAGNMTAQFGDNIGKFQALSANNWVTFGFIDNWKHETSKVLFLQPSSVSIVQGSTLQFKNVNFFDLTQMFGSTIADYIYSLETATAGAGVAWFRNLFPKPYYAYDAGSLQSVQAGSHVTTGFNQISEVEFGNIDASGEDSGTNAKYIRTKGYIKVVPNTTYCFSVNKNTRNIQLYVLTYDGNKTLISRYAVASGIVASSTHPTFSTTGVGYIRAFVYATTEFSSVNEIEMCINLHWDGERDGEYEAYSAHTYALDSDLVLRGLPKLDSNNKLYYDGDRYQSDGTVTRKYGIVDLGTLTWTYDSGNSLFISKITDALVGSSSKGVLCVCKKYLSTAYRATMSWGSFPDMGISVGNNYSASVNLAIKDSTAGTDATAFTTSMSGVYLVYELATPTTESADPFTNPQEVNPYGTEEFVDAGTTASTPTRDVEIPVGHETYNANICPITGWTECNIYNETEYDASATPKISITFPNPPGTVYGGTLTVNKDGTGTLVVDRATDVIDENSSITSNGILPYGGAEIKYVPSAIKKPASSLLTEGLLSNIFKATEDIIVPYVVQGRTTSGNIFFNMPSNVTTKEEASTWFGNNNTQISYLLATPVTYTLTAEQVGQILSVKGVNNVWCDIGAVEVYYTKL